MKTIRPHIIFTVIISLMTVNTHAHSHKNPFLTAYDTPFECVPFDKIQDKDYTEALEAGIKEMKANVEAIVTNSAKPTFANTIEALEDCSPILERVEGVLFNLVEADRTDFLDSISEKYAPACCSVPEIRSGSSPKHAAKSRSCPCCSSR